MTEKKIRLVLKNIADCKNEGHYMEALLLNYHLNIDILKFLAARLCKSKPEEDIKAKKLLELVVKELESDSRLKSTINKRNIKTLKPWLSKMDEYLKSLRIKKPSNTSGLLNEGEKIFGILNISVTKILLNH